MLDQGLSAYANELFGGEDVVLRNMREGAEREGVPPIQVVPELARLLTVLIRIQQPRRILEIGTLFGYAATVMARAAGSRATITTLEVHPKHAAIARRNFESAGLSDRIEVIEGPALDSLKSLHGKEFDFVFIDADKGTYPDYLRAALELSHPGTVIVADNLWRAGAVLDDTGDENATGAARFNHALAGTPNLVSALVPTRDGGDAASVSVVLSASDAD